MRSAISVVSHMLALLAGGGVILAIQPESPPELGSTAPGVPCMSTPTTGVPSTPSLIVRKEPCDHEHVIAELTDRVAVLEAELEPLRAEARAEADRRAAATRVRAEWGASPHATMHERISRYLDDTARVDEFALEFANAYMTLAGDGDLHVLDGLTDDHWQQWEARCHLFSRGLVALRAIRKAIVANGGRIELGTHHEKVAAASQRTRGILYSNTPGIPEELKLAWVGATRSLTEPNQ